MPDARRLQPDFPPALTATLAAVREALACEAYLVGGFVRDCLLGREAADIDLAVTCEPGSAAARVAAALEGHSFPLDDGRGQYRVVLSGEHRVRYVDVAPLRGSVTRDLELRDFTVDAMAAPLLPGGQAGDLIDPLGGAADIAARLLRLASDHALHDDPLRMLRAVRLAAELDFEVEPATASAIREASSRVVEAAPERRRDEVCRILATPRSSHALRLMDSLCLLDHVLPELTPTRGVDQPKEHYWDVFNHSIETVAVLDSLLHPDAPATRWTPFAVPFRELLDWPSLQTYLEGHAGASTRLVLTKLAALLHDVAKPETKAADHTGRVRFLGHAELGARTAASVCSRLRFGRRETAYVALLVEEHLRPTQLSNGSVPTDRAIFRFYRDLGEGAVGCLVLSLADAAAAVGPRLTIDRWRGYVTYIGYVMERHGEQEQKLPARHKLSGNTIMAALAIGPGPLVGQIQRAVDEAAATGDVATDEEALNFARVLYKTWRQEPTGAEAGKP